MNAAQLPVICLCLKRHFLSGGIGLALLLPLRLFAQDPIFSQFYANKMYLNPALTAYEDGTTVNVQYRDQWRQVRSGYSKFTTSSVGVAMDVPCLHSGFGLLYVNNIEGEGFLQWNMVGASYAYRLLKDGTKFNDQWDLVGGLRASYNWRQFNWQNLVFADQLDPVYGIVGNTQLNPPANVATGEGNFDVDAGFVATNKSWRLGFAASHLLHQKTSFYGTPQRLPIRWTLHASFLKKWTYKPGAGLSKATLILAPIARLDFQDASASPNAASFVSLNMGCAVSTLGLFGGVWLQSRYLVPDFNNLSSAVVQMGFEARGKAADYRMSLSRDFTIAGTTTPLGGAWEAACIINLKKMYPCAPRTVSFRMKHRECPAL